MKHLEIATYTNVYAPSLNGVAVSVESFREALHRRGHHSVVFAPSPESTQDDRFVVRYPALDLPWQKYPLAVPVSAFADKVFALASPDIIHAHHPALLGRTALEKSEQFDIPLVFTYHTRYHDYAHYAEPLPAEKVADLLTHWLGHYMSYCHQVLVPSESIKTMLSERYGINEGVSVVATGVDTERFGAVTREEARRELGWSGDELVLVSAGRLAQEKNFQTLLRALTHLPENPDWKLVILGDGLLREELEQLALDIGVKDRVVFQGSVPFAEMPKFYAAADIFTFASVTETQGLVTLEAMASHLPVAAVRASGTQDVLDEGVQGFLTDNDPEALASAIHRLIQDEELRKACAVEARAKAKACSPDRQAAVLEEAYQRALDNHARGQMVSPDLRSHWETFKSLFSTTLKAS